MDPGVGSMTEPRSTDSDAAESMTVRDAASPLKETNQTETTLTIWDADNPLAYITGDYMEVTQ